MKTKTFKRLSLNQETISNLSITRMNNLKGGTATGLSCELCNTHASCLNPTNCLWEYTCQPTCENDSKVCW